MSRRLTSAANQAEMVFFWWSFSVGAGGEDRMRTQIRNGMAHAAVAEQPLVLESHQSAQDFAAACLDQWRLPWLQSSSATPQLYDLLVTRQQLLDKALLQIDGFQRQESILKRKIARLSKEGTQARQFAYHDELTGLPNRRLLLDRFNQAVARAARQQRQVALLFLDLDRFKIINDTLGHAAGDNLLQQVAARLVACVRTSDTACRVGGDEFIVLLPELEGPEHAIAAERKIRACLSKPYLVGGTRIEVTTSIGMAVYPADGMGYVDLTRQSDVAMYGEKARNHATSSPPQPACITR